MSNESVYIKEDIHILNCLKKKRLNFFTIFKFELYLYISTTSFYLS